MKRIAAGENKAKYDFSDPAYDKVRLKFLKLKIMKFFFISVTPCIFLKARSETEEKIHEAVEAAFKAKPKENEKMDNKRKSDEAGMKVFILLKNKKIWENQI